MNAAYPLAHLLFAQMERFSGLRDRFSGPRARFGWEDAFTAVGSIAALTIVLYLLNRWHNRHSGKQSYNSPKAMFRELCRAHKLDRKTRKLLKEVARWQRLAHPARLFLEPERFEPANLSSELASRSAELFELRSRLFEFEVTPESRDLLTLELSVAAQKSFELPRQALNTGAESVGAVAFSNTKLETAAHSKQPSS